MSDDLTHLLETISKVPLRKHDVVVYRTQNVDPVSYDQRRRLIAHIGETVLREKAGWTGAFVVLGPGEDIYRLPDDEARRLYETLRKRFGGR